MGVFWIPTCSRGFGGNRVSLSGAITTEDANVAIGYIMSGGGGSQNIAIGADFYVSMAQICMAKTIFIGRYTMMDCNAGSNALSSNHNMLTGHSFRWNLKQDALQTTIFATGHNSMDAGVNEASNNI